jgi:hypothetical protein
LNTFVVNEPGAAYRGAASAASAPPVVAGVAGADVVVGGVRVESVMVIGSSCDRVEPF